MSKMACVCGGVISDVSGPSATEGWILRDEDQEAHEDALACDVEAFFEAVRAGRREQWIAGYFSADYPTDLNDRSIVSDILCRHRLRDFLSIAECDRCGRLHVRTEPGVNAYRRYAPDKEGYGAALRSSRGTDRRS